MARRFLSRFSSSRQRQRQERTKCQFVTGRVDCHRTSSMDRWAMLSISNRRRTGLSYLSLLFNWEILALRSGRLQVYSMSYPFLEVLFHTYQSKIENKDDALIIFTHWCLISHGFQRLQGNQVRRFSKVTGNEVCLSMSLENRIIAQWLDSASGEFHHHGIHEERHRLQSEVIRCRRSFLRSSVCELPVDSLSRSSMEDSSSETSKVGTSRSTSASTIMSTKTTANFNRLSSIVSWSWMRCCFSRAYKNLNDLKKEFHEKIESLTNGASDSNVTGEGTSTSAGRSGTSSSQQQQTSGRRPMPDDPLIDPLSAGRRPHPYAGGWSVLTQREATYLFDWLQGTNTGWLWARRWGIREFRSGSIWTQYTWRRLVCSRISSSGKTAVNLGMNMDPSMFQPSMR